MIDLNNLKELKKLDPKNVYGSTEMLVDQCEQIWKDSRTLEFSQDYKSVQNIVICGMGGSTYGGHVGLSAFKDELDIPFFVNSDYHLPKFTNENSLVILTSYSGSTEETLSCTDEAIQRKSKIIGMTSGGTLGEFLKKKNLPSLVFNPKHNPSGQPRLGTGYIVLGTLALLNRLGALSLTDKEVQSSIDEIKNNKEIIKESAKKIAKDLQGYIPLTFSGNFLEGNAHIIRNQFNETAKSFSSFHAIPELNHHLMEGLKNPKDNKLKVLFLNSDFYSEIIQKKVKLTKEVVSKNGVPYLEYKAIGDSKLSQVLEVLSFGGYLTLYLAFLYGQDPSLIPWVDFFKEQLKK